MTSHAFQAGKEAALRQIPIHHVYKGVDRGYQQFQHPVSELQSLLTKHERVVKWGIAIFILVVVAIIFFLFARMRSCDKNNDTVEEKKESDNDF